MPAASRLSLLAELRRRRRRRRGVRDFGIGDAISLPSAGATAPAAVPMSRHVDGLLRAHQWTVKAINGFVEQSRRLAMHELAYEQEGERMAYTADMPAAARRSLEAAKMIPAGPRQDVAGYLFGIAAECAIKSMTSTRASDPFRESSDMKTALHAFPQTLETCYSTRCKVEGREPWPH